MPTRPTSVSSHKSSRQGFFSKGMPNNKDVDIHSKGQLRGKAYRSRQIQQTIRGIARKTKNINYKLPHEAQPADITSCHQEHKICRTHKILAIIAIILLFTVNVHWRTIIIEIDPGIVKMVYIINLIMTILISILLIIGTTKKNTMLMLPWIILGILLLVGLLVSVLYTAITLFLNNEEVYHILYGTLFLVFGILIVVIYTYFWFVVYSYFQQLKLEKSNFKIGPYGRPYSYERP
ncbi:PREDICTED: uncharacterized protein LOC105366993 [Ceratosolen solmsi marchali]|uniref:Uncharacterized protein LOC105366993 n=1 Tax=Ceratosolen solmsi marchali TaxID=326594 RepID=A0AAJ7E179_9HYME|nr:PREDICTED: uncharacterized protein LOC105366993 [Ceratosolen solmsi marchali]